MGNKMLQAALTYARRFKWHVIPLKTRGKEPLTSHGSLDATTDAQVIQDWWTRWPNANVAVVCGPSGLIVIDVDPDRGGDEAWEALIKQHGFHDDTVTGLTGGGGTHLVFAAPNGASIRNSVDKLGPGIDVRANGGYVVVPPSVHPNGRPYVWEVTAHPKDCNPAPLPAALLALLTENESQGKPQGAPFLPDRIPEGQRNATLTSLAGSMRRRGASEEAILAALEVENEARCDPPLSEKELKRIAKSIARYEPTEWLPLPAIMEALRRNERGDAELLARLYAGRIAYDHSEGAWYLWTGQFWERDDCEFIRGLVADQTAAQYLHAARKQDNENTAGKLRARASSLGGTVRISHVLKEAASLRGVALVGNEWDANPWLLGVANGTLDLKTGKLHPGRPEEYVKEVAPTPWEGPDAKAPRWRKFLEEIFKGNEELIRFAQRLSGYGTTGFSSEHVFPILWGDGRNGKDTLLRALENTLGSLAGVVGTEVMVDDSRRSPSAATPHLYALRGMRIAWASETKPTTRIDASQVKYATGGGTITARLLNRNPVRFKPRHVLLLVTNYKPRIDVEERALWDRVLMIPFTQRFVDDPQAANEHQRDPDLSEKLKAEASGILAWLVEGCRMWQEQGLEPPQTVKVATKEYQEEMDPLRDFIADCCVLGAAHFTPTSQLRAAYESWAQESGERYLVRGRKWGNALRARNCRDDRRTINGKQVRVWVGIGLLDTKTN